MCNISSYSAHCDHGIDYCDVGVKAISIKPKLHAGKVMLALTMFSLIISQNYSAEVNMSSRLLNFLCISKQNMYNIKMAPE